MILKSSVVGVKHHPGAHDRLVHTLPGSTVELVREPENRFDQNAVAVHIEGVKCGFIPRAQAKALAKDLDGGRQVKAVLWEYNKLEIEVTDEPFHDDDIPDLV